MNRHVSQLVRHTVSVIVAVLLSAIVPIANIAGTVTILPMSPKQGGTVTIEYTPLESDAQMIEAGSLHAVVYLFSIDQEGALAVEVPLERKSGRWTGSTEIPRESVYGIVKVGNGRDYDRNKDLFWEFLVSTDGTRHVEGANMKAAMARFGQLPESYRMKEDLDDAIDYLDAEARLYPKNILAQLNYIMIAKATNRLDERESLDKYRELTASVMQIATPNQALALYQAYVAQEKSNEASSVMEEATRRFPLSLVVEQGSLQKLSQSKSYEEFVGNVRAHLKAFPSSSARQNIIDAVVQGATQQGTFRPLIAFLDATPTVPAMTYYRTVNVIGGVDSLRSEALRLISDGLKASKDASRKPRDVGQSAWNEEQRIARSLLLFIKGAIERVQSRNDDAIASLEQSIQIAGDDAEKVCVQMLID
ncbi:MAG: tetratricopeptide repeat protein, partial [Candidatus Kapaibacterium sp.]